MIEEIPSGGTGRSALTSTARLPLSRLLPALAAALALAAAPPADARTQRISLSLPSSAYAGARVPATGRVSGASHGRRVVLQARSGRRWRKLGSARVSHDGFRVVFSAPNRAEVLVLRAVLYRNKRRVRVSRSRRLLIRVRRQAAVLPLGVAGWGQNGHFELGGGYRNPDSAVPVSLSGVNGVAAVAATYFSSYALMSDGTVRAWGGNAFGQLGDGAHGPSSPNPVAVSGLRGVTAIAAGGAHAMALLGNGTVATWGGNSYGELGNGTTLAGREGTGSDVPVLVPGLSGVVAIAASGGDDAALLGNGTVVAWGENKQGQLGDGTTAEKDVPTPVRGLSGVRAIALGGIPSLGGHLLALLNDGTVRAIGGDGSGQLGDGGTANSSSPVTVRGLAGVSAISAAVSHNLALLANGSVVAWGANANGELGVASGPEKCGKEALACSKVPVAVGVSNVSAIAAGFRFSLALTGGRVSAWGWNDVGQLGDGNLSDSSVPVPVVGLGGVAAIAAGEHHSLALLQASGPPATIEVIPGPGSLTVNWQAPATTDPWRISWRPVAHPPVRWSKEVLLPPAARSYTITGLSAQPYEVAVRNNALGSKIATGTPIG